MISDNQFDLGGLPFFFLPKNVGSKLKNVHVYAGNKAHFTISFLLLMNIFPLETLLKINSFGWVVSWDNLHGKENETTH